MQDNEALLRLKELLNETQALARVGSFEWDIQSGKVTWSDQLFEIFGVDPKTFTPSFEAYMSFVMPEYRTQVMQSIYAAIESRGKFETIETITRPDGSQRVISSRGRVIVDDNGLPVRLIGACMDISQQASALSELQASQDRYRALVDHASDSLVLHDDHGQIIDVNTRACSLLGYTREEMIGQRPMLYNREMTEQDLLQLVTELHKNEQVIFEANHTDRSGRVFPVEVRLRAFKENGQSRAVALSLDITERRLAEATRVENEQRLRRIGDTLPNGALISFSIAANMDLQLEHTSAGFWPMLGYAFSDAPASLKTILDSQPKRQLARWRRALRISAQQRQALDERFLISGGDGIERWLHARCLPTTIDSTTTRWDGVVLDVTEQLETLRELAESNQKYQILTESLPQLVWVMHADLTLEYVSPSALEYTGISFEVARSQWHRVVHPDDLQRVEAILREAVMECREAEGEVRALRFDGQYRWFLARSVPLRDAHGKVQKWLGSGIDIHDRKLAEQALEESERRLRLLVDSANMVVWEADPTSLRFTYVSDCCERMLGYSRQAWLMPDFWIRHLHPDDANEAIEICRHAVEAGVDHRMEYRMVAADGRVVWVEDVVHVNMVDGRITGMQGVMQDISQRKLLEEQLRQSQKMEAIGRLAGGVAHDFNNILTVMMGYAELLLLTTPANDPCRTAINAINDAGKRASGLTRQLLTFSRKAIVAPKVLDLNELVKSTEALLRPTIGEDIKLTIDIDPQVRPIKADRVHIEQVLMNLAINARDAMPQGGAMTITTRNRVSLNNASQPNLDDYVELSLADSGCGISDELIGKIFDPFFTTKEVGRGTGLGLSVVHGVVTGAGGFIQVESQVGKGTTFHLCFPAAAAASPSAADRHDPSTPQGNETILLVEDDRAVRAVTLATLVQQGYRVIDASNGEQALEAFRREPHSFDLLLTDVVMPGMSGRQLAEAARMIRSDIPVLFMSGHTDDAVIQHGISSQADAFIQKPFHPHGLGQKLRELLTRPQ